MKLRIDNVDCTTWLDAEMRPRVVRKLNQPVLMTFGLAGKDVPNPEVNARVELRCESGDAVFTGYVSVEPVREYLGWNEEGAVYRYVVEAIGDELMLDDEVLPQRPTFVMRKSGDILREITHARANELADMSLIGDGDLVTQFSAGLKKWSECAKAVADQTRCAYCVVDGQVKLRPIGEVALTLDEADETFSPERLKSRSPGQVVNAVTVLGKNELDTYVKDYFLGDGYELRFNLSDTPYGSSTSTVFEQEYKDELDPLWWRRSGAASVNSGRLWMQGSGDVEFAELVELRGALSFQHGDVQFQAASDGVIGGLYDGETVVAGFQLTKEEGESRIAAIIDGAAAGHTITTQAGHRYLLSTRVYASETVRAGERFHSSESIHSGTLRAADARVVLEVHEVDPNDVASLVTAATVLFDGVLTNVSSFCRYALLSARDINCSVAYTRLLRMPNVVVRSALPNEPYQTRLVGAMTDGAECRIYNQDLTFYSPNVPSANERIVAEYRVGRRSSANARDEQSVAAIGVREAAVTGISPLAKTSEDCEEAAKAILEDTTKQAWSGEYETWSDFLRHDLWPGEAVELRIPSRECEASAIVREIDVHVIDPANDRSWYTIKFANEAAEPIAIQTSSASASEWSSAIAQEQARFVLANLPQAAVTKITSTAVTIDTGTEAIGSGGFDVRRTDSGWDPMVDRNLIGRFQTRTITVPRLSRVQTYCVRQYDANGNYSRCATQLHVDYPL